MKTIKANDLIRLASWANSYAKVGTLADYRGRPITLREVAEAHLKHGQEVWTTQTGAFLSSDRNHYDRERALYNTAIVVEHGEVVEIDGILFSVNVINGNGGSAPRNSDPIHFKRVDNAALEAEMRMVLEEKPGAF